MWMYMSPLSALAGHAVAKVIIRLALAIVVLGGLFAQLGLLAHNVPLETRRFWMLSLLIVEGIPLLSILLYRDYKNRNNIAGKR
jgi:hypothetical protein